MHRNKLIEKRRITEQSWVNMNRKQRKQKAVELQWCLNMRKSVLNGSLKEIILWVKKQKCMNKLKDCKSEKTSFFETMKSWEQRIKGVENTFLIMLQMLLLVELLASNSSWVLLITLAQVQQDTWLGKVWLEHYNKISSTKQWQRWKKTLTINLLEVKKIEIVVAVKTQLQTQNKTDMVIEISIHIICWICIIYCNNLIKSYL